MPTALSTEDSALAPGSLTNRGTDTFAWDYEERMTSPTVGRTTTTFAYRRDGLRDSRTTSGNTATFTRDIAAGLPVVIDDGNQYVYGAGLEEMVSGGNTYYYLADGLGSTMAIVDSTGAVQKSYTYDVYGKPTATGTLPNEFDFAGQQTDPTGLQYLRARYMDPETGTFLSREPLAALPGWLGNHFGYALAAPADLSDASGLKPVDDGGDAPQLVAGSDCSVYCWVWINPASFALRIQGGWIEQLITFDVRNDVYRFCELVGEKNVCTESFSGADLRAFAADLAREWFAGEYWEPIFAVLSGVLGTQAAAKQIAEAAGWKEVKVDWSAKGQKVFKKGNRYIARDIDSHSGGAWKEFDAKGNRIGTLDKSFTRIGK